MKNLRVCLCAVLLIMTWSLFFANADESSRKFMPSSAPISVRSPEADETRLTFGLNSIGMTIDWKEPHFSGAVAEPIGDVEFDTRHFALGLQKSVSDKSFFEVDLLIGTADIEASRDECTTDLMGWEKVDVTLDGDGSDLAFRFVYGYSLFRNDRLDLRLAGSLHTSYFETESEILGITRDGMYGQSYSETESGFLFRPAIALQPSIRIGESVVLYPFIGLSESYGIVTLEWDLDYTLAEGRRVPFTQEAMAAIRMDASDSRWSGEGTDSVDVGTTMFAGFDVGMLVGKSGGEISLGAAISELSGETDSSDFQEAHIVYSYPL